jgi:cell division protein FtsZ
VVATGIDHAADTKLTRSSQAPVSAPEAKLAELTQRLRTDQQRMAERVERVERGAQRAPAAAGGFAPANPHAQEAIEAAAKAAVEAAVLPMAGLEDVTIRPLQPKPSLFPEPSVEPKAVEAPPATAFIPPSPERPANRGQRMPRIDELPLPAQNELRAQRGEAAPSEHPEKRRMGLLQRLASVGLGRREDDAPVSQQPPRPQLPPLPRMPERPMAPRPAPRPQAQSRPPESVSEFAKRPTHQGLDPLGRQAPVHNSPEEDQLDIPAFLRRQAN